MITKKFSPALLSLALLTVSYPTWIQSEMQEEDEDMSCFSCDEDDSEGLECDEQTCVTGSCPAALMNSIQSKQMVKKEECHYADLAIAVYKKRAHEMPGTQFKVEDLNLENYSREQMVSLLSANAEYAKLMHAAIIKSAPKVYASAMMCTKREEQNQLLSGVFSMLADAVVWQGVAYELRALAQDVMQE